MSNADEMRLKLVQAYERIMRQTRAPFDEALRQAYHQLMQQEGFHPDMGGNHEQAAILNTLYEELSGVSLAPQTPANPNDSLKPAKKASKSSALDFANYQKILCSECGASHTIYVNESRNNVPDALNCRVCSAIILPTQKRERLHRRDSMELVAQLTTSYNLKPVTVKILDFSPKGVRIISNRPIEAFEKLYLICDEFKASGEAVWMKKITKPRQETAYEVGVRFDQFEAQKNSTLHHSVI